jgi:hypothetical protein
VSNFEHFSISGNEILLLGLKISADGTEMPHQSVSGGFERLAALQAMHAMARGDESTKWAHALGSEIAVAWFPAEQSSQRSGYVSTQTPHTAKKRLRQGSHKRSYLVTLWTS